MTFEFPGESRLDYYPCRYGRSKLLFRGPRRKLDGRYAAVVGGSESYGKYVAHPFPALLEDTVGFPVVNFGHMHAGIDLFANDSVVMDACSDATVVIVQLLAAHTMSNGLYSVHPHRNDRFLNASTLMKTLFRDLNFDEFVFTRHLLWAVKEQFPDRFEILAEELRKAWTAAMRQLLRRIDAKTLLLWIDDKPGEENEALGFHPLRVTEEMVADIRPDAAGLVRFRPSEAARNAGLDGMIFSPLDEPIARHLPGPSYHAEIAAALLPAVRRLL